MSRISHPEDTATFAQYLIQATQDQRIMLLNSHSRQNAKLMTLLREYHGDHMYFHVTPIENHDLARWLLEFSYDPGFPLEFGQALRQELKMSDDPANWGAALAHDLNQLCQEQSLIVLDNFELASGDELTRFVQALGAEVSPQTRVLITAHAARPNWQMILQSGTVFQLDEQTELGASTFDESMLQGHLEVHALSGLARVSVDGFPISSWEGTLPKHLFFFFVDRPYVTREEVFEAFWPGFSVKDATNIFHVTKRKISEKLGYDLTIFENGAYVPNPRLTRFYDVAAFEKHIQAAMSAPDLQTAEENWRAALDLYRGHFMKEAKTDWIVQRRAILKDMYVQALTSLGEIYRQQGQAELALAYFVRAASEKPEREDICRQTMALYAEQGRLDAVATEYKRLEDYLKTQLSARPSAETRDAYQKYMRK